MDVKLVTASGKNAGQEVPVTGPRFFIGRAEDCQLRPRSDLISRHHCVILLEEGFIAVRDFGSKNGTFVNGERVLSEAELKSGDILKIGALEFEVRMGVELKGKKKPKVHSVQEAAARTVQSATTAKRKDAEDDFASWLDENEGANTETTAMEPTQTAEAVKDTKVTKPAPEQPPEEEPSEEEEEEEKPKPTREAFKMPTGPSKPSAASSKDAAASMLKNFFRRR